MQVLVWVPPWVAQGHPLFFENAFRRHLMAQANLLAMAGATVTVVAGELLADRVAPARGVQVRPITMARASEMLGSLSDPSVLLYREPNAPLTQRIADGIAPLLDRHYDVILLWETPVPFLEALFPEALILHQMPGAVSRPPFPPTVTADPLGLYRRGSVHLWAHTIANQPLSPGDAEVVSEFRHRAHLLLDAFTPFRRVDLDPEGRFSQLLLVPLQVSEHYAFQTDTPYRTQSEFLLDVLHRVGPDVGVVVTQYVTPRVHDRIMNPEFTESLRRRWPNLIYQPTFDRYSAVSQYMLPYVDAVCTCSSSLGFQAAFWDKTLVVPQPTYLERFADITELGPTTNLSVHDPAAQQRRERLLAYLLMRQQPLAAALIDDAPFLTRYLELLIDRQRQSSDGDRSVHLREVDEAYDRRLLGGFRPADAAKDVRRDHPVYEVQAREAARFNAAVQRSEIRFITFDVFDTLVNRPVLRPKDVFGLLQKRADQLTGGRAIGLIRARPAAEATARRESFRGEVTFDEIYRTLNREYRLEDELLAKLQALEIEIEVALAGPREAGKRLWAIAKQSGKPIVLITDMYLPRPVIERILQKCGFSDYARLFVSNEARVRKLEGPLFDVVLRELSVDGGEVLHVGDHPVSDGRSAEARGIKTFRVAAGPERMGTNDRYSKRMHDGVASSVMTSLIAHRMFDSEAGGREQRSHFLGQPFYLGYAGLGPIATSYAMWLHRETAEHGVSRLLFLSREGAIFKQVYDVLKASGFDGPPSEYFRASRRALCVASIFTRNDMLAVASRRFREEEATVGALLEGRFGLAQDAVPISTLQSFGYSSPAETSAKLSEGSFSLGAMALALEDKIMKNAARERANYFKYIERTGLLGTPNPAVVDLGWAGNMQAALEHLVGRPVPGYYYATLDPALPLAHKGLVMHGYGGEFVVGDRHPSVVIARRPLAEYLFCNADRSLKCFTETGEPLFQLAGEAPFRADFIRSVHEGIVAFARDLTTRMGPLLVDLHIDPYLAEACYKDFLLRPSPMDSALLAGHYHEDSFGGSSRRYFIASQERNEQTMVRASVWKEGAKVYARAKFKAPTAPATALRGNATLAKGIFDRVLRPVELKAVRTFSSERKQRKYERDRLSFFADSSKGLARSWGEWSSRLTNGHNPKPQR